MTDNNIGKLIVFSGKVRNIQVVHDTKDFILSPVSKTIGTSAAVGLATIGLGGAAVSALQSSTDTGDRVQYFRCEVDGKLVTGCFSVVFFSDGDEVDIVATLQDDSIYYAYAVRRPIDHRLWLHPHCNKGRVAHSRSGNKISIYVGLISYLMTIIMAVFLYDGNVRHTIIPLIIGLFVSSSISLFTYFYLRSGWSDYNILAEKIFSTLGYSHPELVDMDKESRQYFKDCIKHGEYTYIKESEQDDQIHIAPWVYRYRKAPQLPESSKLKE